MWLTLLAIPPLLLAVAWPTAALLVDGPRSRVAASIIAGVYACGMIVFMIVGGPIGWGGAAVVLGFLSVLGWWLTLRPSSDREWETSLERTPIVERDGDAVTIHNVRNFRYRTTEDFDELWETRNYDLKKLRGVDLFIVYWGPKFMAHTIASWEFDGGVHLPISIEVRKVRGEKFSAIQGFFRRFELHYVVGDERDLIGLRTNYRKEEAFLYRLTIQRETALGILKEYLSELEVLATRPRWYNAATRNCTTAIRRHVKRVSPNDPWDLRILLNGRLDELLYERAHVDTTLPFAELRARSAISDRAHDTPEGADFSAHIRADLPGEEHPALPELRA